MRCFFFTFAQANTDSIRWRTREAVSFFAAQMGSSTLRTSASSIEAIGNEPITGEA